MFHINLKNKRLLNNLSQKEVAESLNISHQSVSKWENGDALPSIEYLPKLAELMNCSIDDFFVTAESEAFNYTILSDFFYLMFQLYQEEITTEDIVAFIMEHPSARNNVHAFCDYLNEYKIINAKHIQNVFCCSEKEAKSFMEHLENCELVEKADCNNTYIVDRDAVDGMKVLLCAYKQIEELCMKKNA